MKERIPDTVLILPAAGSSRRFGSDKLFFMLHDSPVFTHAVRTVAPLLEPDRIILAVHPDRIEEFAAACKTYLPGIPVRLIPGGATRTESVWNALQAAKEIPGVRYAAIHDAARPFLTADMFRICLDSCRKYGGALLAHRICDTVKEIDAQGCSAATRNRDQLRAAETPQIFELAPLITAYEQAMAQGGTYTDDAQVMELFSGLHPFLVENPTDNRKITYPGDLR